MSTALQIVPDERPQAALIRPVIGAKAVMELHDSIAAMVQGTLVDGKDFGVIPGTNKPSLYKSGAERLCVGFGLVDTYEIIETEVNHMFENPWEKRKKDGTVYKSGTALGLYSYTVKCLLRRREDNMLVAEGIGCCSSLESKYCDRPRDVANTILKMAKKRAKVDATLSGLGLSDRFTQDVEDEDRSVEDEHGHRTSRPTGSEVKAATPKPAAEKLFPFDGPFKGTPIGTMPLHAIEGYVAWIEKKQAEKGDDSLFGELLDALTEVLPAARDVQAAKEAQEASGDGPQHSAAGSGDQVPSSGAAPASSEVLDVTKMSTAQLQAEALQAMKHESMGAEFVSGTLAQIPSITHVELQKLVRQLRAMIEAAPPKKKKGDRQPHSFGNLPGGV